MSLKEIRYYYFYAVRYYAISGSDVSESRTFVDSIRTSLDSVARKRASEIMAHLRYHDKNFSRVISVDVYKSSEQDATLALASLDNSKIIYSARNFDVKQPTPPKKSVFEKLDDYFSNN